MTTIDHKYAIVVGHLTDSGVVQCFGPFDTEELANEALEYLKTWDAMDLGGRSVEISRMTPLPPFTDQKPKFTPDFTPLPPLMPTWPTSPTSPTIICTHAVNDSGSD